MRAGEFQQRDRDIHPPAHTPNYKTSVLRAPRVPLWSLQNSLSEVTGPIFTPDELGPLDNDLFRNYAKDGEPIGEQIIVHGYVFDGNARPISGTLVEIWQANSGGRYRHKKDTFRAPIDPNFGGCGRMMTDEVRPLFFPYGKTRGISFPQFHQQLASGSHPLFDFRPWLRAAADYADVLRGRSADPSQFNHRDHPRQIRGRTFGRGTRYRGGSPA